MRDFSLALAFTTIERPRVAQRLVRSVRKYFPDLPIYVADQSRLIEPMATLYKQMNVEFVRMPYDAGVCASRNLLVKEIKETFFVLCDDDFFIGGNTSFSDAITILENHSEIGVVGGSLSDVDDALSISGRRRWELYLHYDPTNRILTSVPIDYFAPVVRELGAIRFYLCDAVLNFCVFRKCIFSPQVQWDERFKSNGEHEDFFLNLKMRSKHRVAYLPTMTAYHNNPAEYKMYRLRLRERQDGWREFMRKWNIDQYLEVSRGVRVVS
jgi:GT2 family glycosyltransferase